MMKYILVGCLLFTGCDLVQPKVTVKVPAYDSYDSILAWCMAESMDKDLVPIPNPNPNPKPDNQLKDGDDCPKCIDGFRPGDGVVRPRCVSCNGDGVCNTGDPILLPQEISVVVQSSTNYIKDQLEGLEESVDILKKRMDEFKSCECVKEEPKVEENIIPQPQYKEVEWYYIFKDGDYYFWYENERAFKNKAGNSVVVLSNLSIPKDTEVTICHGNHCLRHQIYKLTSKVEVKSGGPEPNSQLQNGTSRN